LTEEVLKDQIFDQITEEWTKRRFIDHEASLDEFAEEAKAQMGKRLNMAEAGCLLEEWKGRMKP